MPPTMHMLATMHAGETAHITSADLNALGVPVTSGAIVTISVYNPDGSLFSSGPAVANDDDWSLDVNMPDVVGQCRVTAEATAGGAIGRKDGTIRLIAF